MGIKINVDTDLVDACKEGIISEEKALLLQLLRNSEQLKEDKKKESTGIILTSGDTTPSRAG